MPRGVSTPPDGDGRQPDLQRHAPPQDSELLFTAALDTLANPGLTPETFLTGRYALFQSPRTKKGSDAVNRTLTVAVGALALGDAAPALPADIDLRCYVLGQAASRCP